MIIDLQTVSEVHLGFILFADADNNKSSGDCIIRTLPHDPTLLESEEYEFLGNFQDAGELAFRFEENGNKLYIGDDSLGLYFERAMQEEIYIEKKSSLSIIGRLVEDKEDA